MAKNIIKLNRGDSYAFKVSANLSKTDVAYFALLYPHQRFENAIVTKGYTIADQIDENGNNTGEILIKIEPRDTNCLASGIYYYTVKAYCGGALNEADGSYENAQDVYTLIERTKFIINE
jgi:hypothetical protein